jgi:hypothetical protein
MTVLFQIVSWLAASAVAALFAAGAYAGTLTVLSLAAEAATLTTSGISFVIGVVAFVAAIPVHLGGIVLSAPFARFLLKRAGRDDARSAAITGAALAMLAGLVLFGATGGLPGLVLAIPTPVSGAVGAAVYRAMMKTQP